MPCQAAREVQLTNAHLPLPPESSTPNDVPLPSAPVAQDLSGNASDYESDLTITAADTRRFVVTAQGRTPSAARTLAIGAAVALRTILDAIKAPDTITYTVVPPPGGP
nr:hypothetical protein [Rhodococcus qingshengii]